MGPLSSDNFMYLSLQTKKPDFVSLNTFLTWHTGHVIWHAATLKFLSVMDAF